MNSFRLSNHIFELGLNALELSVYAYLCSLPAAGFTLQGAEVISVKQRTIAANCGIKSPVTIAKTIDRLREKGLVDYLERSRKANGHHGTYRYAVTKQQTNTGFFTVDRSYPVRCSCICFSANHSARFCRIAGTATMTSPRRSG